MPTVTLCAIALLAGLALGLYTNVRGLLVALAVAAVAVFAAALHGGESIGAGLLHGVAVIVLVQLGYFAGILVRAVSGFDKRAQNTAPDSTPDAESRPPESPNQPRCDHDSGHGATSARDRATTRTDAD